jgi:CRP-like cAMP-binding protein
MESNASPDTMKKLSSHGRLLDSEHFPILQGMSPVMIGILNNASNLMHVSEDVELLHEGDTTHDLYFIASGCVSIAKHVGKNEKMLRKLGSGDVFGEFGTLRGKARFASVHTHELSVIIRVKAAAARQVLEIDETFRERLEQLMDKRILLSFISSHPVFQDLSDTAVINLSDTLNLRFILQENPIFIQGERIDAPSMIVSGEATVRMDGDVQVLLEMRRSNEIIGAARDKSGLAVYSALASSDTDLLILDEAAMALLRSHSAAVADRLEQLIAECAANTFKRIAKFSA